jgi:chaperone required for assembly of F1-ATPase
MWTAASFSGTPSAINLPALPSGLGWDTSELLTKTGTLRVVKKTTAIQSVSAGSNNDGKIYDLNGNQVKTPLKKGIYIKNGRKVVIK